MLSNTWLTDIVTSTCKVQTHSNRIISATVTEMSQYVTDDHEFVVCTTQSPAHISHPQHLSSVQAMTHPLKNTVITRTHGGLKC